MREIFRMLRRSGSNCLEQVSAHLGDHHNAHALRRNHLSGEAAGLRFCGDTSSFVSHRAHGAPSAPYLEVRIRGLGGARRAQSGVPP
jgi:hypothetical protein